MYQVSEAKRPSFACHRKSICYSILLRIVAALFAVCFVVSATQAQKTLSDVESKQLLDLVMSMRQGGTSNPPPERAHKCGSPVALQFRALENEFSPALRREANQALARPSLPFFYDSPGGSFRIHYATSGIDAVLNAGTDNVGPRGAPGADGVPDYVNSVAEIFDSVRVRILGDTLLGNFGYPVPPSDTFASADTNFRYDIYTPNLGGNFFGATFAETLVPDYFIQGQPFSSYTSYIQIDNDYVEPSYSAVNDYVARPLDAVRVTAAHEYFHAIHFGIDAFEFGGSAPNFRFYWYEISSVSMEELLYDGINDYYAYLYNTFNPTPFREPHRSLQTFSFAGPDSDYPYAYGVFAMFLNDEFGPTLQRGIWRGCGRQGPDFLRAIDSALIAHTNGEYDFSKAFQEFGIRMAFTGSKAKFAPPGRKLDEAEFFPEITDTSRADINPAANVPSPTVVTTYPVIVLPALQEPPPESNSNTFTLFKNVFAVADGCFRLLAGKSNTFTPARVSARLALIGYPANSSGTAFISTADDDFIFLDTSILVNPFDFDSITQMYRDSFICHNSVEIQFDTSMQDSFRIIVTNSQPTVELPDPGNFKEAVFIFTQTSTDYQDYDLSLTTPFHFFYVMTDTTIATSDQPYGVFASFPNPVTQLDNFVTIGFSRSLAQPPSTPLSLDVTVLTEAGEKVRAELFVRESVGVQLEVDWDLRNQSGREVASGVYILLLRLLSDDGQVLQSETSKILVIR